MYPVRLLLYEIDIYTHIYIIHYSIRRVYTTPLQPNLEAKKLCFNTLRPIKKTGRYFPDDIFKRNE